MPDTKRMLDVLSATVLLIITAPVVAIGALLILADAGAPWLFTQVRAGLHGRRFMIFKLRTLHADVGEPEDLGQVHLTSPHVTRAGRVLRRFKIDELPQLWNVVRGDMSLVGPRPTLPQQVASYSAIQLRRLDVKPGLTGIAQVCGGTALSWSDRILLDVWYVEHRTLWLDLRILARTVHTLAIGERRDEGMLRRASAYVTRRCIDQPSLPGQPHLRPPLVDVCRGESLAAPARAWGAASLAVMDQGISSATNVGVSLVAARYLGARSFGIFSAAFLLYVVALGMARALTTEPFAVRYAASPLAVRNTAATAALGTAVALGAVSASALLLLSRALPHDVAAVAVTLALVLPGLLVQDSCRLVAFTLGRPRAAVENDAIWLGCTVAALGLVIGGQHLNGTWLLAAWGVGGHIAAVAAMTRLRIRPRPSRSRTWLVDNLDLGARYLGEFLAVQVSGQMTVYAVGLSTGFTELAALRGAQVLYGPYHVVDDGIRQLSMPQLTVAYTRDRKRANRLLRRLATVMVLVAAGTGLALLSTPPRLGAEILGETWPRARELIVPLMVQKASLGIGLGAFCGLRILQAAQAGMRARLVAAGIAALGGYSGAWLGGAFGAAWGMAAGQAVGAVVFWVTYRGARTIAEARGDTGPHSMRMIDTTLPCDQADATHRETITRPTEWTS